jgi:hypothetical protein
MYCRQRSTLRRLIFGPKNGEPLKETAAALASKGSQLRRLLNRARGLHGTRTRSARLLLSPPAAAGFSAKADL